jgi:hypothetical protein
MNSELTPEKLAAHLYHDVVIVSYGDVNIALECNDCGEVLADCDTEISTVDEAQS